MRYQLAHTTFATLAPAGILGSHGRRRVPREPLDRRNPATPLSQENH
jgi:hypothetical protein